MLGRRSTIIPQVAPIVPLLVTGGGGGGDGGGSGAVAGLGRPLRGFGGLAATPQAVLGDMIVTKEMLERFYELASPLVTQVWCHPIELDVPLLRRGGGTNTAPGAGAAGAPFAMPLPPSPTTTRRVQVLVAVAVMSPEPFLCWARRGIKAKKKQKKRKMKKEKGRSSSSSSGGGGSGGCWGSGSGRGLEALSQSPEARRRVEMDFDEAADAYGLPACYKVARLILEPDPFSTENALQTPLYQLCRGALQAHYKAAIENLRGELLAEWERIHSS